MDLSQFCQVLRNVTRKEENKENAHRQNKVQQQSNQFSQMIIEHQLCGDGSINKFLLYKMQ